MKYLDVFIAEEDIEIFTLDFRFFGFRRHLANRLS
jgi:hypothetical protein